MTWWFAHTCPMNRTVMAKTASLNATNRPGVRCTEGGSCPALPPGARAAVNERTQRVTEAAHALIFGDGIRTDGSHWRGLPRAATRQLSKTPDSVGSSAANPVAQVQHPIAPDHHVGVLQQVLAVHRAEVP